MRRAVVLLSLALGTGAWALALVAAPGARAGDGTALLRLAAATIYAAGAVVCHQDPARSFHRRGVPMPVCARCAGLYGGAAVGMLLWIGWAGLGRHPSALARSLAARLQLRWWLILVGAPTVATVVTAWLGWWDASHVMRAALASPLGLLVGAIVAAGAAGDLG